MAVVLMSLAVSNAKAENVLFINPLNETMQDIRVSQNLPNNNYNSNSNLNVENNSDSIGVSYLMFALNTSIFPQEETTILEVYVGMTRTSSPSDNDVYVHEVNKTFDETDMTWNNQPCGNSVVSGAFNLLSPICNPIWENGTAKISASNPINYTWNVTNAVNRSIKEGRGNISFIFTTYDTTGIAFQSKDISATDSKNAYLNITFVRKNLNPEINISLNNTALVQGYIVNVTGNWSDRDGGSIGQIITNQTGENVIYNFSLSGTSGYFGQNITIAVGNTHVLNFTTRLNDTTNKFNQSSQIIVVGDITLPKIINFSLQRQPIINKSDTNIFQVLCEDIDSFLGRINFTIRFNQTTRNMTRIINFASGSAGGIGIQSISEDTITLDTKNYIWNYSLFSSDETAKEGFYNITDVGCIDKSSNYARNDSENKLVGYDFLMDTPPLINSRSPSNGGTVSSTSIVGNAVISEDNPSFMLIFHNITGVWKLNQTINYSGDGSDLNNFNLSAMTNGKTYAYALSINSSFGTWTNSSNNTFTVSISTGGGGGDIGGGGGGGGTQATVIIEKNQTIITGQCVPDGLCDAKNGEDSFNCNIRTGGDCEFKVEEVLPTCIFDKNQQCIYRTAIFGRILAIAVIISFLILISDTTQGRKIRKVLKERLNINLLKE